MKKQVEVSVRKVEKNDLVRLVELSAQLGYENTIDVMAKRFHELDSSEDHILVVAELLSTSTIVGCVHFKRHKSFFADESLEVGGLVVDKDHRGLGIGALLMAKADEVARSWKVQSVRLTSNIKRTEAHQFYRKLGFEQPKTSHFFIKRLDNG